MEEVVVKTEPVELAIEYDELSLDVVKQEIEIEPTQLQRPDVVLFPKPIKLEYVKSEIASSPSAFSQIDSNSDVRAQADVSQSNFRCSLSTESQNSKQQDSAISSECFQCDKCLQRFEENEKFTDHIVSCGTMREDAKTDVQTHNLIAIYPVNESNSERLEIEYSNEFVDHGKSYSRDTLGQLVSTSSDGAESHSISRINLQRRERPFTCADCNKKFTTKSILRMHIMSIHTGLKPYSCISCNKNFSTRYKYNVHMRIHTGLKPFMCSLCSKSFAEKYLMTVHLDRIHSKEKPFMCSICDKRFFTKYKLKMHMRIHLGVKPFTCTVCNKSFTQNINLKVHMRIHIGLKLFTCSVCSKQFSRNFELKTHLRIHTGEKPFACLTCNKGFNTQSNLNSHMKVHTGVKPFVCSTCNKCFTSRYVLQRHTKVHA